MSQNPLLSELESWIVSYLAIEQLKLGPGRQVATVSPESLVHMIPDFLLPSVNSTSDLTQTLIGLMQKGVIRNTGYNDYYDEDSRFNISPDGLLLFRKFIRPLATATNQSDYRQKIDATRGNETVKKELKNLQGKLKDKTEDEAIDAIIDIAKKYGHHAIIFIVKLLLQTPS